MGDKFIFIIVVIGLISCFAIGYQVGHNPQTGKIDTVTAISYRYDTIPVHDTIYIPTNEGPAQLISVRDTTIIHDTITAGLPMVREYTQEFTDKWAVIRARMTVMGYLLHAEVNYSNLKPAILKTKTIDRTVTVRIPPSGFYVGAYAGSDIYLQAEYKMRSGWGVGGLYSHLSHNYLVGISKKIF